MTKPIEPEVIRVKKTHQVRPGKLPAIMIPLTKVSLLVLVTVISWIVPDMLPLVDEILLSTVTMLEFQDLGNRLLGRRK